MKKLLILFVLLITLMLCACNNNGKSIEHKSSEYTDGPTFVCIESGDEYRIVYHRETKVMYVVSRTYSTDAPRAIFTVMLDAEGKPLLYRGD